MTIIQQTKSWSFSRLLDFESCAYRAKLKVIDKVPEPERPLPAGKTEHANDRGSRVHDMCEKFVRGTGPLPPEAEKFRDEFESLATKFKTKGVVSLEGEWGFNKAWEPTDYRSKDCWLRVKCDAVVWLSKKHAVVIDYKTGRKFGNEIKHGEQCQLYALALFMRHPELETITVELWYLDADELTHDVKAAKKWAYYLKFFNNRGLKMTNATSFPPNPTQFTCKWCPYKGYACTFGV